jgi:hypothetical protein
MVEKVREKTGDLVLVLKDMGGRAWVLITQWGEKLWALLPGQIREKFPWLEGKMAFILIGLASVILALAVSLGVSRGPDRVNGPVAAAGMFKPAPIPPDQLFLPEEPDFLPGVILEREQRDAWTAEDAEPYWYNPLEQGEGEWRERVEQVIDELLERIP